MSIRSGTAAAILAVASSIAVAADQPSWLPLLKMQLKESHGCMLDKVLYSRDLKVGADTGTEGRVSCIDRREYDFMRKKEHQRFELRLCQPTVC